ncbi:MAG: ADP-ribosylation factor-like protein [Promethearchaeota archaeon]
MKVLIFGPGGAGKTSLMRTTCMGYSFVKVTNLQPTKGISRENFIFRGLLEITVWDAGGQQRYMERYFTEKQKPLVFSDVHVAIFMVDATVLEARVREIFEDFLKALKEFSNELKQVYVLINKIDLDESREDEVFDLLTKDLPTELHALCAFTPVSVKEGTAQQRLIEILDLYLKSSTEERQKQGRIRASLDKLKIDTVSDILLFNRPDGLIISSTLGTVLETEPLKFLTFELGTIESNVYSIFSAVYEMQERKMSALNLASVIYESKDSWVVLREITDTATIMVISKHKQPQTLPAILDALSDENDHVKKLQRDLEWANI